MTVYSTAQISNHELLAQDPRHLEETLKECFYETIDPARPNWQVLLFPSDKEIVTDESILPDNHDYEQGVLDLFSNPKQYRVWERSGEVTDEDLIFCSIITRPMALLAFKNAVASGIRAAEASTKIGLMYLHGIGCRQDVERGVKSLEVAANKRYPRAVFCLAMLYLKGVPGHVTVEKERGNELLKEAVGLKCSLALTKKGFHYEDIGKHVDAVGCFAAAAKLGEATAICKLGFYRLHGLIASDRTLIVSKNPKKAWKFFGRAARGGNYIANKKLAEGFAFGVHGLRVNNEKAKEYIAAATDLEVQEAELYRRR